jgi:predicted nucleic acid-binding protein
MVVTDWLIDKSALVRLASSPEAGHWLDRCEKALVRVATPTLLEIGFSAKSEADWHKLVEGPPVIWLPHEYVTPGAEQRAVEVQAELAARGQHADKDSDLVAEVTGQPTEWLRLPL